MCFWYGGTTIPKKSARSELSLKFSIFWPSGGAAPGCQVCGPIGKTVPAFWSGPMAESKKRAKLKGCEFLHGVMRSNRNLDFDFQDGVIVNDRPEERCWRGPGVLQVKTKSRKKSKPDQRDCDFGKVHDAFQFCQKAESKNPIFSEAKNAFILASLGKNIENH